jgi:hypothetical protein
MTSRKALRSFVPGFVALLVLSIAGFAQAHTFTYTRAVSISESHTADSYTFSGTVSVTNADAGYTVGECTDVKTVTLLKDGVVAGTGTTSAGGQYSITVSVTSNLGFVASVEADLGNTTHPDNHICAAARSGTLPLVLDKTITDPPTRSGGGEVAFTGSAVAIPLAAVALLLLLIGSGLMWLGRRRHPA